MPPSADATSENKVNVLLVDDRPANLLALEAILDELRQNLVRAFSGEEALRLLESDDFAVVLLDVNMPGLGGFETARLIRSRERSRHTPIIFLTAHHSDAFPVVEAYRLGAVDYLVKPLIPEILRAKVAVFVDLARKAQQIQHQAEQLHRAAQERAERQALVQHAVAGLLAGADDPARAIPEVLRVTCEGLGWDAAALWVVQREAGVLHCEGFRGSTTTEMAAFEAACRRNFVPREGLPGRVWAAGEPAWIEDVARDDNFPRVRPALAAGLHGACGLPVRLGQQVVAVLEFFSRQALPRDENMLAALVAVGSQVGQSLERRRAEQEVRRSQRELADFVENATVGMHWVGPDGRILWANRAELELLGYSREEYIGRHIADFHVDAPVIEDILRRLAADEQLYEYEARLRCKDGSIRYVVVNSNVLREDGRFIHTRCFTRDITQRKQAEEALKEANRRKDEFLAMLAHELRNPLAPLLTSLQVLRQAGADPVLRQEELDRLQRQVRHLGRLVDDLLDVARLAHGRVSLRCERLDLARLARTAAEDRRAVLEQAGLALVVQAPQTPVWVCGDGTRLTQVLNNLLDNAARFTPSGGRVEVSVTAHEDDSRALVRVADTGAGIEPALLPRLFEVFSQGEQGIDRARGGLGLGLALVRGVMELHRGTVEVASAGPGQGATFTLRLPLEPEPHALNEGISPPPAQGRPARVLIVEDSRDAAESLRMLLEVLGHEVRIARTGMEGVTAAEQWRPEVVVSDIGLPGIDGYEVARRVRRLPGLEDVLLVALTGYGSEEDRLRAREAGFSHHLVKPADPADLQRLLAARGT